eukprot:gnl/Spiro4/11279_TR5943_c0_g1_i1.p1 gnl/Spiro4/11279_TR5943_c0_g1~~gnl/Spiro4/11279_TR5943_c0_g1_i1.p1  ORF type:complete len:694 (+),score=139.84 gnl/Spiro4/11279_TR5943_c0_g1_i1:39-2120(+)
MNPLLQPLDNVLISDGVVPYAALSGPDAQYAVHVDNLDHSYGSTPVLNSLNMKVPSGSIYGLLGPSGCGKTTLLKILVGRLSVQAGHVEVMGATPGTVGHEVPGSWVGYMPQDLSLYFDFTIRETLEYYARLHDMPTELFLERKDYILSFLELPTENRLVRQLSGGQQRRVSLAAALLHHPRLLILDEPTVGVDPLLRQRIWNYLLKIASEGVSVIITTHYIEEARQADVVGLMRGGRLLAEDSPNTLIARSGKVTLEDVFLSLCEQDSDPAVKDDPGTAPPPPALHSHVEPDKPRFACCGGAPRCKRIKALLWKGCKRMLRNYAFLIFQFLLPTIQVSLYCIAIGRDPSNLPVAVVNSDSPPLFSSQFLSYLDTSALKLENYASYADGINAVKAGNAWGVLYFPKSYSTNLQNLPATLLADCNVSDSFLDDTSMHVSLDMTNQQIYFVIESKLMLAFKAFEDATLKNHSCNPHLSSLPIMFDAPVYGPQTTPKFTDFIAPGIIITITFAQAISLTALVFVLEKKEGTLDRTWAAGVRPLEVMLSHIVLQLCLLLIQIGLLLCVALFVFQLPMVGNVGLVLFLVVVLGMTGMLYGLVISSVCNNEQEALQLSLGSFFPTLLLSGIIWPVEAIPAYLRWFSVAMPTTWAANAMRSIMMRGWGLAEREVWTSFCVIGGWCVFFTLLAARGVRNRD